MKHLNKYNEFISDFKVSNEELEVFEMFILSGGEYGLNRDIYTVQSVSQGNKFKYLLSKIFRPFRFVVKIDHPKWWQYTLLPIYYINMSNLTSEEQSALASSNTYLKKENWGTPTTLFMYGKTVVDSIGGYVEKETLENFAKENFVVE